LVQNQEEEEEVEEGEVDAALKLSIVNPRRSDCALQFKLKSDEAFTPVLEAFEKKFRKLTKNGTFIYSFQKQLVSRDCTPASLGLRNHDVIVALGNTAMVQLCSFVFREMQCYTPACQFAHDASELDFKKRALRFKRKLCVAGNCKLGAHCLFAHGVHELRSDGALPSGPVATYFRGSSNLVFA
jgi:hypothetical protein